LNQYAALSTEFKIANRPVGPGNSIYIIAEAGSNHGRNLQKALALVDAAADAGCDAVRFQTFSADEIAADWECPETALPKDFSRWGKNLKELYETYAMPDEFHEPLL
jgi:sialic acid synthase SpsE